MELYDNPECTGSNLTKGITLNPSILLGSACMSFCLRPASAYGGGDPKSIWGGRPDGNGDLFLGLILKDSIEIKCAVFVDGNS